MGEKQGMAFGVLRPPWKHKAWPWGDKIVPWYSPEQYGLTVQARQRGLQQPIRGAGAGPVRSGVARRHCKS